MREIKKLSTAPPAGVRYVPRSDENIAEIIARAAGFLGPCCDYLFETAKALSKAGIQDESLDRLVRMVKGRRKNL